MPPRRVVIVAAGRYGRGASARKGGSMSAPTYAVLVRLRSSLDRDEIERIMKERAPEFRALEGLVQKYYLEDVEPGVYGGFYLWRSLDDVQQYRESELAASIAAAYRGVGAPEVDVFRILMPLRD
jgi:heme-degrading monooxygenase HmoA